MNFYDELKPQKAIIELGGEEIEVKRARLAKHFMLNSLAGSEDPFDMLNYVAVAADIPIDVVSELDFSDIIDAYRILLTLNTLHGEFPFHTRKKQFDRLDYVGRELATVVHTLATAYGWGRDEIFNLIPEEAMFYILETLVEDHDEKEYLYDISGVGYDKANRKRKYPQLPYAWSSEKAEGMGKPLKITKERAEEIGYMPSGVIIKYEDLKGGTNAN